MTDHMTAKEYRQMMGIDVPEFDEVRGKKRSIASNSDSVPRSGYKFRTGVAVFEGGKKVKEINGDWQGVKKSRNNEEDQITMQVADYCELLMVQKKIQCYSHIPQETFTKSWAIKNKNKAMGVRAGVPDMIIVFHDRVLFLELKRAKGGVVSESQKAWIQSLNNVAEKNGTHYGSVVAKVAAGFSEAKSAIDDLLE